jgi:pantoate--beta-alanine ligase
MKILINNNDLNEALYSVSNLGFVPTMGSLHKGHISLIKKSLKKSNTTIVSIFVNRKQFNNKNDYRNYPRNYKKDFVILKKLNVNYLYLPKEKDIYDSLKKSKLKLSKKDNILCANHRKGHFEGVIDVMDRLTNKIHPKKIFMGEKDFQQLYLVKKYIEKKYKSRIIPCKTIRDKNKLALSSRNLLLNKKELLQAGKLAQNIINFKSKLTNKKITKNLLDIKKKELIKKFDVNVEYFELRNLSNLKVSNTIKNSKFFISYFIKKVRLIDNF